VERCIRGRSKRVQCAVGIYVQVLASDRQRIEAFVRRGVRSGFYSADSPTAAELVSDSDDSLFENVFISISYCYINENHILHKLLPERSKRDYYLRPRSHDRSLAVREKKTFLVECCSKTSASRFIYFSIHFFHIFAFYDFSIYSTVLHDISCLLHYCTLPS